MKFLLSCFVLLLISLNQIAEATSFFPICGSSGSAFQDGIAFIQESVRSCLDKVVKREPKKEPSSLLEWIAGLGEEEEDYNFLTEANKFLLKLHHQVLDNLILIVLVSAFLCYILVSRKHFETRQQLPLLDASENEDEASARGSDIAEDVHDSDFETTSGIAIIPPVQVECNKCTCGSYSSVSECGDGKPINN